jgi:predicted neutral ceramidase superfamily lipid hydrolase
LTITSAALAFVMIAGALRTGRGVGYGFVLVTTPVAILLARSRRSAVRVHPRKYHRSYSMATVWCLIVAVAAYWYWVLRDPKGPPLWLTTAVALVAAVPLALVGQRLVGGGRSR